ncbi:pimeloyl-ACP methyl ester carboxylesterase [Kibdelosporangium banguiense]|uniref:Pimeloyl-ACP methyl ester carboxylesterase n=1 Tax=Kibdelosporangium banguiense TaxID=1365924 RepID=A0ABS4T903_9PSEU|nr:alpha/beta fold hydrolase [Kibdelosporangium banguiense]MBP2320894.1 pimeloyl-ACP methyl ester carboxylesterase [Kibdelosporangium banguiense]
MKISYTRRGSGSPLVLLHGIGHRWQAWQPVLDKLATAHDVIALDLPGFGNSPSLPEPYSVSAAVEAAVETFREFGIERPHLAGNSLGGMLALELASAGHASSVTALAPAGFWSSARARSWALRMLSVIRASGRLPERTRVAVMSRKSLRMASGSLLFGHPSRVPVEAMLGDLAAMAAAPGFDAVARAGRDYFFTSSAPTVPVTVAWGTRDRILWPSQARRAAMLLPAAKHVSLPGCGHVPMHDEPEVVARLILETCAQASVRS